jgi:threonine/homoserine/homoserine lactone efflux protein
VAVFTAIKLAGAAYLIYLGVQAVRHRRSLAEALGVTAAKKTPLRILGDGVLVGRIGA